MKRLHVIYFILILVFATSCMSVKDLTYLQDLENSQYLSDTEIEHIQYRIRTGDILYVNVKTLDHEVNQLFNPSSSGGYMTGTLQMYGSPAAQAINGYHVDSVGNITLPILGKINVSKKTIKQVERSIMESASIYLKDPMVKVQLLSFRINISGEVKLPGLYYNYEDGLNILDAISMAGGITDHADVKNVLVLRKDESNNINSYSMDLSNRQFFESEGFILHPSDEIIIKAGPNKKIDMNTRIYQLFITSVSTIVGLRIFYDPLIN